MKTFTRGLSAIAASGLLTACVTLPLGAEVQQNFCETIAEALQQSPAMLQEEADAGHGRAQLAYAIVLDHGLNGRLPDHDLAMAYRERAVAVRGTTTTAIYVPGINKVPGHTQLVSIPRTDVSVAEMRTVDACLALLSSKQLDSTALRRGVCGGSENYQRLKALWSAAHPTA
jgi:hypothetical protein